MADLRDVEEIIPNRRLNRRQMIKRGFEFDLYVERQSNWIVPYDAIISHANSYPPFHVASVEHLWVLKLEAFADRRHSVKGEKDAQDLLRVAAIATRGSLGFRAKIAAPYIRDSHLELLELVERGPHAVALARGNVREAKRRRHAFGDLAQGIRAAYHGVINDGDSSSP